MGRSVSYPSNAAQVAYAYFNGEDGDDFQFAIYCFRVQLQDKYPSLVECEEWIGREDRAVLENKLCYVGVSEYCGLVAVWIVPKEAFGALAERFCAQADIDTPAGAIGECLRSVGRASNGEQFFERIG